MQWPDYTQVRFSVSGFRRQAVSTEEACLVSWWWWEEKIRKRVTPLRTNHSFFGSEMALQRLVQKWCPHPGASECYGWTVWGSSRDKGSSGMGLPFFFLLTLGPSLWSACDDATAVTWPVAEGPILQSAEHQLLTETNGTWRHSAPCSNWAHSSHCR